VIFVHPETQGKKKKKRNRAQTKWHAKLEDGGGGTGHWDRPHTSSFLIKSLVLLLMRSTSQKIHLLEI
jgi:hypothetical protein